MKSKKQPIAGKPDKPRKPGRPSIYNETLAREICERLQTRAAHQVFADADMPSEVTFYKWLSVHPEFAQMYARAREIRALARADRVDEIMSDMRNEKIDHQQARVMLDAVKWQTAKENPRVFGDKQEIDHKSSDGSMSPLTEDQRRLLDKTLDGAY